VTTAILVATVGGSAPAAAQPWDDATVLRRLVDQLASLGIHTAHVIARPEGARALGQSLTGAPATVRVHESRTPSDDLRAIAAAAREIDCGAVVMYGDIVTQREALAGLLALPRIPTGVLTAWWRRPFTQHLRVTRGRVVSAGSPYHAVHKPTTTFHGVLKVAQRNRRDLVEVAERLADELDPPLPPEWQAELDRKPERWRAALAQTEEEGVLSDAEIEAEVDRRMAITREDVLSPVVLGLVRGGVQVGAVQLRKLFWARPLDDDGLAKAAEDIKSHDEDRVLLNASVKATDGFFTTFFVSTYSKYIARWAARVGLTPNMVTTISLLIGIAAAASFATGERAGLIAGAVLAYFAFVTDCVDGQLARYTRTFSKFGAWLDSVFDRAKEYVIFAGLAIGSARAGDDVWTLAAACLTLQIARHAMDFSFGSVKQGRIEDVPQPPIEQAADAARQAAMARAAQRREAEGSAGADGGEASAPAPVAAPAPPQGGRAMLRRAVRRWTDLDNSRLVLWLKKIVIFPIGERFAVISITAAFFTARTTFTVFLAWGGFAALYAFSGRFLRSLAR
jgi:hypothetical protein